MSGFRIAADAIADADSPNNHGNGYTLRVWLRSGPVFHGGVLRLNEAARSLALDIWERAAELGGAEAPTGRTAYIDTAEIVAVEVAW